MRVNESNPPVIDHTSRDNTGSVASRPPPPGSGRGRHRRAMPNLQRGGHALQLLRHALRRSGCHG
jgi:hypothetical protein